MIIEKVWIFRFIFFIWSVCSFASDETEKYQKSLNLIQETAESICGRSQNSGGSGNIELSVAVKAEVSELIKKLTDLQIGADGKYQNERYENVLQKDLPAVLKDNRACKRDVFNRLSDVLLPPSNKPNKLPGDKKKTPNTAASLNPPRSFVSDQQNISGNGNIQIKGSGNVVEIPRAQVDKYPLPEGFSLDEENFMLDTAGKRICESRRTRTPTGGTECATSCKLWDGTFMYVDNWCHFY